MLLNCGIGEHSWCSCPLVLIPWSAGRSNQSILQEISPGCSLEGLMLKLKTPILWPPDAKSWLIWKDPDAGKDWGQEEKGTKEDEMVGWHHQHNWCGFGGTPGVGDGQGDLVCCGSWGQKELDSTEWLNWTESNWTECFSGFPYFLQFKSELHNKEIMIWATVSSQSCFASPSLAAKNIINQISVSTIWSCPYVELSPAFLEESICYDQWVLSAKVLASAMLHCVLHAQICLLVQICQLVSLNFDFCIQSHMMKMTSFFVCAISRRSCSLHRTVQLHPFWH